MNLPSVPDTENGVHWRVCHVNLARGFRGGERQTELLAHGLAGLGVSQTLVVRAGEPLASRLSTLADLRVTPVRNSLSAAIAIGRADLIHVHEGRSLRSAWLNSRVTGTPYLITRRVLSIPRRHWLNRNMYHRAAAVAVLSKAVGTAVRSLDATVDCCVIPSAASAEPASPGAIDALRASWGGEFVIGHIGALDDKDKGQHQIIEIARLLCDSHPELRFVLVGGGPDEAGLRAAASGLPSVHFAGHTEHVGDYLGAFDLFLFPSRREGLGSILLDAMASGLPVVASRVGGIPELIEDGVNGCLLEVDDVPGMAQVLCALAGDPARRAQMIKANRLRASEFSAAVMTERYLEMYRRITGGPHGETG
ncbi:MAG: glycosyltransferase family 4 protein [Gammaproteobacteria bacterium]